MEEISRLPYEKCKLLSIPPQTSCTAEVIANFDKLDLWSNRLDSEYPPDDINYNEGKAKKTHSFHKICKYYGKNRNVFLFLSTLRNEDTKATIMKNISERCSNDTKVIEGFTKKMRTHLSRAAKGELEADGFVQDRELTSFFNGYHVNTAEHPRNIHENLNINVVHPMKILETSSYFIYGTPLMEIENSELKKVKISANGERVLNIFKDENGKRNYVYTKQADMELEIGWTAKKSNGDELPCVVILKFNSGKIALEKMTVKGQEDTSKISIPELAKQNTSVLVKNKDLHYLLDKLVMNRIKETALEISSVVRSSLLEVDPINVLSVEKLIIQQIPKKAANGEKEILADFGKLDFSKGPFSTTDELNYNDGIEANPFDKIVKLYNTRKDVILFNQILLNARKRTKILEMVKEKCSSFEDRVSLEVQFKIKMDVYAERIIHGTAEANEILGNEVEGYFYGCYTDDKDKPQNIHANLIVSVTKNGQVLKTSNILSKLTTKMRAGCSKLERLKIFGNGKRIMTILKGDGQRNYLFSKFTYMTLEIRWISLEMTTGKDINCGLTLEIKGGQVCMKMASIDGTAVKLAQIYAYAQENKEILLKNKSLAKTLEEIFDDGTPDTQLTNAKKSTQKAANAEGTVVPRSILNCESKEMLTVQLKEKAPEFVHNISEHHDFEEVLCDFENLDFSAGPFKSDDQLNYNDGEKASPFEKIRKYYWKHKDIFLFIAVIYDHGHREKVLKMAKRKCGKDIETFLSFEQAITLYLDRASLGRIHAMQFMGDDYGHGMVGFFQGRHVADENRRRNIHANLNISVGVSDMALSISDYFHRPTPCYEVEKGTVECVRIFTNGRKILKVIKMGSGLRNYTYTSFAELSLEVKWKAIEDSDSVSGGGKVRECMVVLKIKNDDLSISKATLDGVTVQPANILELAKQNDKVLFHSKSLYDLVHFSTLRGAIKGATTLFFTAAQGGDATKLNNKCTDVFLMLMLQDDEEKERILDMVSKTSSKPEESRKEFLHRMDVFKQKFANGDYNLEARKIVKGKRRIGSASGTAAAGIATCKAKGATGGDKPKKGTKSSAATVKTKLPVKAGTEGASASADDFVVIDESDLVDEMSGAFGGLGITCNDGNEDDDGGNDTPVE